MKHVTALALVSLLTAQCWAQSGAATPPSAPPKAPASAPPTAAAPIYVLFTFDRGDVVLELDPAKAPVTVKNFMRYVSEGFYDNTMIHRVVPNFVIQGGGYNANFTGKATKDPIQNEWKNGLPNTRGSISMARMPEPNSATSQFFLNLKDNPMLDGVQGAGYAVFGRVISGMDVVDGIAKVQTGPQVSTEASGGTLNMSDVPVTPVLILKAKEITAEEAKAAAGSAKSTGAAAPAAPARDSSPTTEAVRAFFLAMVTLDEQGIRKVTLPNDKASTLWTGQAPPKEVLPMLKQQFESMTCRECAVGEVVDLGGGKTMTVTESMVSPTSKVLMPTFPGQARSFPLPVVMVDGAWKVDASALIEARLAAQRMMEGKNAKP